MRQQDIYIALDWLKPSLDELSDDIIGILSQLKSHSQISDVKEIIHQISGTLLLSELTSYHLLFEELEKYCDFIVANKKNIEDAKHILKSVTFFKIELHKFHVSKKENKSLVFLKINEIRALMGLSPVMAENDNHVINHQQLIPANINTQVKLDENNLQTLHLAWDKQIKNTDLAPKETLANLSKLADYLRLGFSDIEKKALWHVVFEWLNSLVLNLKSDEENWLHNYSNSLTELSVTFSEDENTSHINELIHEFIFYLLSFDALTEESRELVDKYNKDKLNKSSKVLDRVAFILENIESSISVDNRVDTIQLKESLELLDVTGWGIYSQQVNKILDAVNQNEGNADSQVIENLALLKNTIENTKNLFHDYEETEILSNAKDAAIREIRVNIENIKEIFNNYCLSKNTEDLLPIPTLFNNIDGTLKLVELPAVKKTLDQLVLVFQQVITADVPVLDWKEIDLIAEALTAIEYYFDKLVQHYNDESILLAADDNIASAKINIQNNIENPMNIQSIQDRRKSLKPDVTHYDDSGALLPNTLKDEKELIVTDQNTNTTNDENNLQESMEVLMDNHSKEDTGFFDFSDDVKEQTKEPLNTNPNAKVEDDFVFEFDENISETENQGASLVDIEDKTTSEDEFAFDEFDFENVTSTNIKQANVLDDIDISDSVSQQDLTQVQLLASTESNDNAAINDDELLFDEFNDFQDLSNINMDNNELFANDEQGKTSNTDLTGNAEYPLDNLKKLPDSDEIEKAELLLKPDDFDQDETIKEIYIEEADEVLEHIQKYLPIWQTNITDLQSLTEIRRAYHTLKGSGRMVGAFTAGEVAWAIENLLNRVIDKSIEPNEAILQLVNKTVDIFPQYIEDYANGRESRLNPIISIVQANNLIAKKSINSGLPALEQTVDSGVQNIDSASVENVQPMSNDDNEVNQFAEINSVDLSDVLDAEIVSNQDLTLDDMSFDFEDNNTKADKPTEIDLLNDDISLFDTSEQILDTSAAIDNESISNEVDDLIETDDVSSSDAQTTNQESNSVGEGNKVEPELQEWIDLIEIPEDDNESDPDIQEIFNEEVEEVLELVNKRVIDLQVDKTDSSALADIRRGYHTLKGSGRMVGAKKLGEFAWHIEDMLNRVIDKSIRLDDDILKILETATAVVPDLVNGNFGVNHIPLMACAKSYSKNEGVGLETSIALLSSSPVNEQDVSNDVIPNQLVDDAGVNENQLVVEDNGLEEIDELKVVFLEEADELVETIQTYVNNNPIGGAITNELIRALHTLRGSAAMSNIDVLHDLHMAMENLCRTYLAHEQDLETAHIDLLQALLDRTQHHVNCYRNNEPVDYHSIDVTLVEKIQNMQLSSDSNSENRRNHVSNYLDLGIDDLLDLEYEIVNVTESNKPVYFAKLAEQTDVLYNNSKDEVVLNRLAKHLNKVYNIIINNKDLQNHEKVEAHLIYTHQQLVQIFDAIAASQIVENKPEVFNRLDTFKEWIRNQPEENTSNEEINKQEDTEFNFEEFSAVSDSIIQTEPNDEVDNVVSLDDSESQNLSDIDAALGFLNDDAEQQFLDKEQSKIFEDIEQKRNMQRVQQTETNTESSDFGSILDGLSSSLSDEIEVEEPNDNVTQNISALEEITLPVNNTISSLPIINKTIQLNTDEVLEKELSSLNDIDDAFSFEDESLTVGQDASDTESDMDDNVALALNDSESEGQQGVEGTNVSEFDFLLEQDSDKKEVEPTNIEESELHVKEDVEVITENDEFVEAESPVSIEETIETEIVDTVQEENSLTEENSVNEVNQVMDAPSEVTADDEADEIEEELLPIFTEEAQETVLEIEKEFSNWANDNSDLTALGALQRHLHTIKGGARMVGANKIGNLTHEAETVYEMLTNQKIVASPAIVRFMQHIQDVVAKQVDDLCTDPALVQSAKPELNTISSFVNDLDETILVNFFGADGSENKHDEPVEQVEIAQPVETETVNNEEIDSKNDIVTDESVDKREPVKEISGVVNKMDLLTVPAKVIAVISPQDWNETDKPDEEMLEIFLEEAEEINETSSQLFHKWCQDVSDLEVLKTLQRELHTLKGGARMAGVASVGDLAHEMEFLYEDYALQKYQPVPSVGKLLSQSHDWLSEAIFVLKDGKNPGDANVLIEPLQEYRKSPNEFNVANFESNADVSVNDAITGIKQISQPEETSSDELDNQTVTIKQENIAQELSQEREEVTTSNFDAEGMKIEDLNISEEDAATALTLPAMTGEFESDSETKAGSNEVIRISSGLMEKLINLSGEAVINRGRIEVSNSNFLTTIEEMGATIQRLADQLRRMDLELEEQIHAQYEGEMIENDDFDPLEMDQYSSLNQLSKSLSESASDLIDLKTTMIDRTRESDALLLQLSRIQSDLQDSLMNSRLVAFTKIVPRLQRIIRQTANELNKSVELKIENGDIELDRTILDKITSPLEHMLRNAVDHGVETPDERSQSGKQPKGTISLTLEREGGEIFVKVKDDGKGINAEAVKKKALDRGLITNPDLPDYEIHQLIFHAGLSTKQQVTQISGRGVGMDVVQSEIKQLGGTVFVDSEYGKGSQFTMRLPLTVAVSDALVVRSADKQYAIPLVQIERIERLSLIGIEQYIQSDEENIKIGDESYALHYLNTLMDETSVFNSDVITTNSLPVIILKTVSEKKQAIFVDELSGSRTEIVVKPLGQQFSKIQGVSAATIQGDGSVMLILDLPALIRNAPTTQKVVAPVQETPKASADGKTHVMVIDDSVTVRKVTSRLLERNGLVAHTAKDGLDAIEKLQDFVPDIMLLDIEMPRMDGFEVATRVRKDMRLVNVPIIMITSRTGEKHRERAFEIGVNCYMGKPFQEKELLQNIDELINISIFDE